MPILLLAAALSTQSPAAATADRCVPRLSHWQAPSLDPGHHQLINVVRFWRGQVTWNNAPVDDATLTRYLQLMGQMNPAPLLILDPQGAPDCARAQQVRDLIDRHAACASIGQCGQGRQEQWGIDNSPTPAPPPPPPHKTKT